VDPQKKRLKTEHCVAKNRRKWKQGGNSDGPNNRPKPKKKIKKDETGTGEGG